MREFEEKGLRKRNTLLYTGLDDISVANYHAAYVRVPVFIMCTAYLFTVLLESYYCKDYRATSGEECLKMNSIVQLEPPQGQRISSPYVDLSLYAVLPVPLCLMLFYKCNKIFLIESNQFYAAFDVQ